MRRALAALLIVLAWQTPTLAGTFLNSNLCPNDPFVITHAATFTTSETELVIKVCGDETFPDILLSDLDAAIGLWNSLTAVSPNCEDCLLIEEADQEPVDQPFDPTTALAHELGHCAMGLGHPNQAGSSFTASRRDCPNPPPITFDVGPDGMRGSADDAPIPNAGTRILHWFRSADNDPSAIDGTIIDGDTFSRRRTDLPSGDRWPANGNRIVMESLGSPNTHALMYSRGFRGSRVTGLAADDVATVEFARSGPDSDAGTPDDYSVTLERVDDCSEADIEVSYRSIDPMQPGQVAPIGLCAADIEVAVPAQPGAPELHHRVVPFGGAYEKIQVEINSDATWGDLVFTDGFEGGNLDQWSDATQP